MSYPLNGSLNGTLVAGGNGNGGNYNQLNLPTGFYIDSLTNSLIIAHDGQSNIVRWALGASNWTLITGNLNGMSGNGPSEFARPTDVALDPMNNMYVADRNNHRIQFFLPNQSSGSTIAGVTNASGNNLTLLNGPTSLMLDNQLNLYVVDQNNNRILKFLRY